METMNKTYRYLAEMLKKEIVSGRFEPNEKLPPVKELAKIYSSSINTMQRALNLLEDEGLIYSKRTVGKYITANSLLISNIRVDVARNLAREFTRRLNEIGVGPEELVAMLKNPEIPYAEEVL